MQLDNDKNEREKVVILFQDMLEVVTRDIMLEDISKYVSFSTKIIIQLWILDRVLLFYFTFINSLLDSIHGASGHEGMVPLEQQYQLFAQAGAIKFPIPETEAWKEKVN